jgi:hypothetical protein
MNNRNKELAEKTINESMHLGIVDFNRFSEKFSELIVKECAELFPLSGRPLSGGAIQCTIKEHFGIE